jgi:hypothetical protein
VGEGTISMFHDDNSSTQNNDFGDSLLMTVAAGNLSSFLHGIPAYHLYLWEKSK